jgi:hypothetical protein
MSSSASRLAGWAPSVGVEEKSSEGSQEQETGISGTYGWHCLSAAIMGIIVFFFFSLAHWGYILCCQPRLNGSGTIRGAEAPSASEKYVPAWRVKAEQQYQARKAAEQRKIDESENKVPPWKVKMIRESQAKKAAEQRKSDQCWKEITHEDFPENIKQVVCGYFYLPPPPINNGWGRQPHIEAYRRKHTQRKGTGWGPMK